MRARVLAIALVVMPLVLSSAALAGPMFHDLAFTADCESWELSGYVPWPPGANFTVVYTFAVASPDGTLEVSGAEPYIGGDTPFHFSGSFETPFCGPVEISGEIYVERHDIHHDLQALPVLTFDCECPGNDCYRRPCYWKRHPEAWPVAELTIGGVLYSQSELIDILQTRGWRDVSIRLARHLIAAKLNIQAGAQNTIQEAIDAGDAFLAEHGLRCRPRRALRREAVQIKRQLAYYNRQGCGDDKAFAEPDSEEIVDSSWTSLKQLYR